MRKLNYEALLDPTRDRVACWNWPYDRQIQYGYAHLMVGKKPHRKCMLAHRWAYERMIGPVPQGLELDHVCRNRLCYNPWHLEPVTRQTNLLRGDTIAAGHAAKTTCIRGHALIAVRSGRAPSGARRYCPICLSMWQRHHYAKHRKQICEAARAYRARKRAQRQTAG